MNDFWFTLISALVLAAIAFYAGWNLSVRNHIRGRTRLSRHVDELEQELAIFKAERDRDPARAWINVGTLSALNEVQRTLDQIRRMLPRQEPN